jgi:drug/metabolite transporter (DMT)-like permease
MVMSSVLAFFTALFGNAILSLGFVLQKKYVNWLSAKRNGVKAKPIEIIGWTSGFILMNIQPIFNYLALHGLSTNVVAATAGSNIAFTTLFSFLLLGEKMRPSKLPWVIVLLCAIGIAGFTSVEESHKFDRLIFYLAFAAPAFLAIVIIINLKRIPKKLIGLSLGAIAGALGGFMVLALQALRHKEGQAFSAWIFSPYLYLYIICGISSFSLKQVAFEKGHMNSVAPSFYGMMVLWPSAAAYLIFLTPIVPAQTISFFMIVLSVSILTI